MCADVGLCVGAVSGIELLKSQLAAQCAVQNRCSADIRVNIRQCGIVCRGSV